MAASRGILGRLAPGFMLFSEWAAAYNRIISARPIKPKTLQNRRCNVRHLTDALGHHRMRSIQPADVAIAVRDIWDSGRTFTARRVLIEAADVFNEALLARVIQTNPALPIKQLPARVSRARLTLEQYRQMLAYAVHRPPWQRHMLMLAAITGQRRADLQKMGFADVQGGHLRVIQQKTGVRLELPLALRLDALGVSLGDAIESCRAYGPEGATLLRKRSGAPLVTASLSCAFRDIFRTACEPWNNEQSPPSLHESRSLAERLYRAQGIDTRVLLGHRRQSMTDQYNNDRGLSRNDWTRLVL